MVESLRARILKAALTTFGKDYQPSPDLPTGLLISVGRTRLIWLLRGLLRLHRPAFVGSGVRFRGKKSVFVGRAATIEAGCSIDGYARNGVRIGDRARLGAHTIVSCTSHLSRYGVGLRMGNDSGIGEFGYVGAAGGVTIGNNVIMGQFVSFHSQEHNYSDPTLLIRLQGQTEKGISIGDNCWIGARVTFLDGACIGTGCVVAAGAVVRGSFPDRTLLAGVPARQIRRLDEVERSANWEANS